MGKEPTTIYELQTLGKHEDTVRRDEVELMINTKVAAIDKKYSGYIKDLIIKEISTLLGDKQL